MVTGVAPQQVAFERRRDSSPWPVGLVAMAIVGSRPCCGEPVWSASGGGRGWRWPYGYSSNFWSPACPQPYCVRSHGEVVRGALASRETNPPDIDPADLPPCISLHGNGIPCPRSRCATAARRFRNSCRLRGLVDSCAGVAGAHRSAHWLGQGVGAGLAFQHCRHGATF